ncbi:uncharacterized protein LOC21403696 [Morus notabilis]|uniref:uncharacterized protein LOC21403696 n=1 Tax=Morus notabilis TaxID=981085 RepID=UPI000CED3E53|nr:uncharacterized protein LOC21403696 [Morus notabilis]
MDITKWCSSGHRRRSIRLGRYYNESSSVSSPYKLSWRFFWIKFRREKMRKIFESSRVNPRRLVPYDPSSYSKNFDRGFAWDDHDHEPDDHDDYISS